MKSGKTTAAAAFPKALLCAFERGYNAIGGIRAQDIVKWSDFKMVLRQLEKPEAHASFETIIIDTISIAWDLCEQYICAQNSVQKIGDIEWGGGYTACKKEFESTLRKITQLGYGVVLIAHNATRIEKTADGSEVEIISPEASLSVPLRFVMVLLILSVISVMNTKMAKTIAGFIQGKLRHYSQVQDLSISRQRLNSVIKNLLMLLVMPLKRLNNLMVLW